MRTWFRQRRQKPKIRSWARSDQNSVSFRVRQSGNSIEILSADFRADLSVSGVVLPPEVDPSFAVWLLMPTAMRERFDIQIEHAVDPLVIENAEQLSAIGEMWMPERYRAIRVFGRGTWAPTAGKSTSTGLFYSGGIDSTYAMLRYVGSLTHAITIHGMDYDADDDAHFAQMRAKTNPLLDQLGLARVVVKTSLAPYMQSATLTHGFGLAGYGFLLRDVFSTAMLAADYTPAQDMLAFPWGTNQVTNAYLAGTGFAIQSVCADTLRSNKLDLIARNPVALSAVSFCADKATRPANCGACSKCVRTKAMFVATSGSYPDIFNDMALTKAHIAALKLHKKSERAFFVELHASATRHGRLDQIPGLAERYASLIETR